jgi:hypothetical protein
MSGGDLRRAGGVLLKMKPSLHVGLGLIDESVYYAFTGRGSPGVSLRTTSK